jgi:hypothetical protein
MLGGTPSSPGRGSRRASVRCSNTDHRGWSTRRRGTARSAIAVAVAGPAIVCGAATAGAAPTSPAYLFSRVAVAHEASTQVTGINDSGTFTGFACNKPCHGAIFFVGKGKTRTNFTISFSNFAPAAAAGPSGIDDAGEVVGFYTDRRGVEHGFVRAPSGTMTALNVPGAATVKGGGTSIDGISAGGVIVGDYFDRNDVERGFIDRNHHLTTYSEPKAGTAKGTGTQINFYVNGEFGGLYFSENGSAHGFYTTRGTAHTVNSPTLPDPTSGYGTELSAASSDGTLYGTVSRPGAAPAEGFADRDGAFTTIKDPKQLGTADSSGTFISNASSRGLVVGNYSYDRSGDRMGMIARRDR